jgi:transcriptional regulator with XRE-family HTH domain
MTKLERRGKMTFGDDLKKWRMSQGYSVRELGRRSGVSPATISRAENDIDVPRPDTLKALAPHLHVELETMLVAAGHLLDDDLILQATSKRNHDSDKIDPAMDALVEQIARRVAQKIRDEEK